MYRRWVRQFRLALPQQLQTFGLALPALAHGVAHHKGRLEALHRLLVLALRRVRRANVHGARGRGGFVANLREHLLGLVQVLARGQIRAIIVMQQAKLNVAVRHALLVVALQP